MIATDFISMFLMGLLGTGHCLGMCGPLIFAFPGSTGRFSSHLWYHAGRLFAYIFCGAVMGGIGAGLVGISAKITATPLKWMLGVQLMLAIFAGGVMFLFGMARFGLLREPEWMSLAAPQKLPGLGRFLKQISDSPKGPLLMLLGGLMGLIPCGLSYAAFAAALPCGGMMCGAWQLLAFGLGTLPGLLCLGTGLAVVLRDYQPQMDLMAGLVMIALAVRMVLKALSIVL